MFKFCTEDLGTKIKFFLTSKEEIAKTEEELKDIFESVITVPGTQKFHKFVPVTPQQIKAFYTSSDRQGEIKCVTGNTDIVNNCVNIKVGSYVVCLYNGQKFVGFVESYNNEFDDFFLCFHL